MGGFVVHRNLNVVYIIYNRVLDGVGLQGKNQAPLIFHHGMGSGPEEPGKCPIPGPGNGILGLVPVAAAAWRGKNGHIRKLLPCQPVETGPHPLRFQPGFLDVIHVPEVAPAA